MTRTPAPSTTPLPAEHVPATAGRLTLAYVVDASAITGVTGLVYLLYPSLLLSVTTLIELCVVLVFTRAITGHTLGSLATRTRAISASRPGAPGLRSEITHALILGLLHFTAIGPLVVHLLAKKGQTLADRAAGIVAIQPAPATPTAQAIEQDAYGRQTVTQSSPTSWATPAPIPHAAPASPTPFAPKPQTEAAPHATHSLQPTVTAQPSTAPRPAVQPTAPMPPQPSIAGVPAQPTAQQPAQTSTQATAMQPTIHTPSQSGARNPLPVTEQATPGAQPATATAASWPPAPTGAPSQPQANPSQREYWVVFDSGEHAPITDSLLIGRSPTAQSPHEKLLGVPDPTRSLSRTHLRIVRSRTGLWVDDLGSANGTVIAHPDGKEITVKPGSPEEVTVGCVIHLGERYFHITSPTR